MKFQWRRTVAVSVSIVIPFIVSADGDDGGGKFLNEHYLNGVAAVVNEQVITVGELRQEIAPILARIESESHTEREFGKKATAAFQNLLDDNIARALIIQDFESSGMKVPEVQKEFQIDEFIRNRFGGDRVLFTQQLRAYGKSLQQFKREIEESLIVGWALNRFHHARECVSPRQILEYYDGNRSNFVIPSAIRLGLIYLPESVIATSDLESDTTEQESGKMVENPEIAQVTAHLNAGEPFATLAKSLDMATSSLADEWLSPDDLREELKAVVERMQVGTCSGKIHLSNGSVAFLYLYERRAEMLQSIEQVQSSIENDIVQLRRDADQNRWINDLRAKAYVETHS
ncbi:MAG: SurA N-terminal domain-containing protein [Puniceicoccales bacterium]|jgi:parvulin-like peptidyl-prolyl isomerase|nr:SurA N-terminal domain-containing protein [Puniceicoccales bacterium]